MLVKPTVAELLEKGENRYRLVIATAKRARQISAGSNPMIKTEDTSPVSVAADEIEESAIKIYDDEEWKEIQSHIIHSTSTQTQKNEE
ncbi:MAG: DNA-directed RNA polymerase subunit omega [Clostridia bacterium]|nr:DNA-directed RNA polymerase subunit omega [Clostridia bacterium]